MITFLKLNNLFFFLLFLSQIVNSQPEPFQVIFGNDQVSEIAIRTHQLEDGSIFYLANVHNGEIQRSDVAVLKLDKEGQLIWRKEFGVAGSEYANSWVYREGMFIIAGEYSTDEPIEKDGFLLTVDTSGNALGLKLFGEEGTFEQFYDIELVPDGVVVTGFVSPESGAGNDILVQKIAQNAADSWKVSLGWEFNEVGVGVVTMPDGRIVVAGDRQLSGLNYNVVAFGLNSEGEVEWQTDVVTSQNGGAKSIIATNDGNVLIVGEMSTPTSPQYDIYLVKMTPEGEILWVNYVASTDNSDAGFGIFESPDGLFYITGYGYNEAAGNTDIHVIAVDQLGEEVARTYYGYDQFDIAYSIAPSIYGGYLLPGTVRVGSDNQMLLAYGKFMTPSAIKKMEAPFHLKLFPNPAREKVSIAFTSQNQKPLLLCKLVALDGTVVRQIEWEGFPRAMEVDLNSLPRGIYLLHFWNEAGWLATKKLVVSD